MTFDEQIKELAEKLVNAEHADKTSCLYDRYVEVFISGANAAKEILQKEKSGAMPLELVDRSREILRDEAAFWKSSHKTLQDAANGEIEKLREDLRIAVGALEFYKDKNWFVARKALAKIKGGSE